MEEKEKSEEPLLQKKGTIEEYLEKKKAEEEKLSEPKKEIITKDNQIEESEESESGKLLQDKLIHKYSQEDAIKVNEDFEGIRCPEAERYKYDPYLESNIINRFFFHWAYIILKMARKYRLVASDLGKPSKKNDSHHFAQNLHRIWDDLGYKNIQSHALFKTVLRSNACSLVIVVILSGIQAGLDYFSVIITKEFIDYFNKEGKIDDSSFTMDLPLWLLGLLFLGTQIVSAFMNLHTQMIQTNFGNRAGYELNCFVYNKILNYAPSGFIQRANHGEIINFIQIDSMRLSFLVSMAPNALVAPMMIGAYIYLLFDFFGIIFLSGLIVLLSFMVSNYFIAKEFRKRQKLMMGKKDICMKTTTETLENIKILKLYNWENEFKNKILNARRIEMDFMAHRYNMTNLNQTINWLCPTLVSIVTIGFYQLFNDSFNISTMLIGLSIFSKLQNPVRMLPNIINQTLETTVSLKRIEDFVKQTDIDSNLIKRGEYDENGEYAIKINGGNFSWGVKQKKKSRWDMVGKKNKQAPKIREIKIDEDNTNIINTKNDIITNSEDENKRTTVRMQDPNDNTENTSNTDNPGNKEGEEIEIDGYKIQVPVPKGIDFDITLKNINLEIKPGELVAIVGEVGCGKSSLLQAIINSLILLNPKECDGIHINGKVGYASQIPWIQNETIRNNILFSKPFDEEKYNRVLSLCQLQEDLETFEGKDLTEIGEKGINLSGGQKVRISLARTIYNEPDIYLFDDPISALDANVGKKIMKNCIVKYLKGKTRVVVTHALSYLKYMDRIIYMKQGRIDWTGNYDEVQNQPFFAELAKSTGFSRVVSDDIKENKEANQQIEKNLIKKKEDEKIIKIIKEEEQSLHGVKCKVYLDYFRYMGGIFYICVVVFIVCLWQANKGGSDLWLAYWSEPENQAENKWVFFSVFSALGIASVIFMFFRICMLTRGVIKLGRTVHRDMVEKLIKAPINLFHETIPRGQIYNRLSKDLDTMNFSMWALGDFLISLLSVVGSFVLCGIYDPYSLIYMPFVFVIGFIVTRFYLGGSRPLTRISSISRSPILNLISETLPGNATIRAFQLEYYYKENYYNKINNSLNINLISRGTSIWFQEMFKFVSIFYLTYLVLKTVLDEDNVTAQSCSIVFTYSVLLQEYLGNIFNRCANLENDMISMERCCKYMDIVQERPSHIPEVDNELIRQQWPTNGEIEFKNFSVRYRPETEIVLKNISFHILPKEKVGVCGRTGSGKSTICLCLFRILESYEGQIFIDNVDISTIGLDLLRSNITIIPQDPCLLEGTLKYNIDPFNKIEGSEIIEILKNIGFDYTESDDKIMDKMIEPGGSNLSVGQKQLVCIARAILRKSKIVVMDEATANIDMNTEQIIQKALNLVLENSTVITVAHRIKTIVNYDKILVLDNGMVKEFDSPTNLLKDENSLFHELWSKSTL